MVEYITEENLLKLNEFSGINEKIEHITVSIDEINIQNKNKIEKDFKKTITTIFDIYETNNILNEYRKNDVESLGIIYDHIRSEKIEPLKTGFIIGGGINVLQLLDMRLVNFPNKIIGLYMVIKTDVVSVGNGINVVMSGFNAFDNKESFNKLCGLYNQKYFTLYTSIKGKIDYNIIQKNPFYLNKDLKNILTAIDISKLSNKFHHEKYINALKKFQEKDFFKNNRDKGLIINID